MPYASRSGRRFAPATIELSAGGTVTFEFGPVLHNVYFDNAPPGAQVGVLSNRFFSLCEISREDRPK